MYLHYVQASYIVVCCNPEITDQSLACYLHTYIYIYTYIGNGSNYMATYVYTQLAF